MGSPVVREHGIHYTDLDPEWVRKCRPWIEDPEFPVEAFAQEVRFEGPQDWMERRADVHAAARDLARKDANERWARLAAEPGTVPVERVVRDLDYSDWRDPTPADVEADSQRGRSRLDWGVRHRGEVAHYGPLDAAHRAVHNDEHGLGLAVRDVTPSPWAPVGGES